jgi:ATP-binding cassette subfamily B protein
MTPKAVTARGRVWSIIAPDRAFLLGGAISGLMSGAAQLIFPQAIALVLDTRRLSLTLALMVTLLLCLDGLGRFGEKFFFNTASQRVVGRLRRVTLDRMLEQEIDFFDKERAGDLTSRLMNDTLALEQALVEELGSGTRAATVMVGGLAILLWTSPLLTFATLLTLLPLVAFLNFMGKVTGRLMRDYQAAIGDVASVASEATASIRTVRALDQEGFVSRRFKDAVAKSLAIGRRHNIMYGVLRGVASVGSELTAVLVIFIAVPLVAGGTLSVGQIAAFVFTGVLTMNAVRDVAVCGTEVRRVSGALERVTEILGREPKVPLDSGEQHDPVRGEIVFDHVRFAYPARPDVEVLSDLHVRIAEGEVVALVGASGAGKSTLASLLLRFHDPQGGGVLVDGADTRSLDGRWLRRRIGFVAQEPTLFTMSIAENISFGLEHVTPADIQAAARAANAHHFISELPRGYETQVGDRGVQLSGGQRQRIAIARTVLKNPRILVLDEATSALDSESEASIHEALERVMVGRTTLLIAHRLSTIRLASRVIVIKDGRVVEDGTHDALMAASSTYADLVEHQIFSS